MSRYFAIGESGEERLTHVALFLHACRARDAFSTPDKPRFVAGSIVGGLVIAVLNNGLQLMSIPQEWQNVILGSVILVAVYADMARKKEA